MTSPLQAWALPRLQRLLPIDDESLKDVISYAASLSKEEGADHLKNLLGDSPPALEFISSFNARRSNVTPAKQPEKTTPTGSAVAHYDDGVPKPGKRGSRKPKAPLHSAGPARQPEGYGNLSGGYTKSYNSGDNYTPPSPKRTNKSGDAFSLSTTPATLQVPESSSKIGDATPGTSRDPSPSERKGTKLPPSASGNLISDFGFANVRSKQSKKPAHTSHSGTSTPNKSASTTTANVADLTSAIAALELATNPTLSTERRVCTCNASIHPLFATAPNCLNCGKIICALEGLQPCSFCDAPILTKEQVNGMIKALKEERGIERMAVHNAAQSRSGSGTPMFGGSTPDSASGDEGAAARARAHRDKLLAFQRENAQRTRVYDEAADYDVSLTAGQTQWMSPVQRAAALKKQQQYVREMEEANRPEWEKKKTVMSMSIKNGKLVKTYSTAKDASPSPKTDVADPAADANEGSDTQHLSAGEQGAFSNNPLLKSGQLIRPVWKPSVEGKGKEVAGEDSTRQRQSVWRRVQDDREDNEQWILDGGLHGYGTESRLTDDGSQRECG